MQVVDSADLARLEDCRAELHALLQEERLFGATLLIFANKQDVPSALPVEELEKVRTVCLSVLSTVRFPAAGFQSSIGPCLPAFRSWISTALRSGTAASSPAAL